MKHLTQEELVLFYYSERDEAAEHLRGCGECRREYQSLQRTLNAVDSLPVPERPEDYGSIVWRRLGPKLGRIPVRRSWWLMWPKWAVAAGLVIAAFFVGRYAPGPVQVAGRQAASQKILLVQVGDHLERSAMILAEIVNSGEPGQGKLDISYEQRVAEDLVGANRLYRVTADSTGDRATSLLLDDLERVLLEIARGPSELTGPQADDLRRDIEERGLLFKVRVFQTRIQEREPTI